MNTDVLLSRLRNNDWVNGARDVFIISTDFVNFGFRRLDMSISTLSICLDIELKHIKVLDMTVVLLK